MTKFLICFLGLFLVSLQGNLQSEPYKTGKGSGYDMAELNLDASALKDDPKDFDITVYPNPVKTHEKLKLESSKDLGEKEVRFYDLKGQKVKKIAIKGNPDQWKVDVSSLGKGLYILKVESKSTLEHKKIMIRGS